MLSGRLSRKFWINHGAAGGLLYRTYVRILCRRRSAMARGGEEGGERMDADEASDLLEELAALRCRVSDLSEAVADARARRIHLEAVIAQLKRELHRLERGGTGSAAGESAGDAR